MGRLSCRGIICIDGKVILIHRIKGEKEYWVVPGGGIEQGESLHEGLRREIQEELGIDVTVGKELLKSSREDGVATEHFFLCKYKSGELGSGDGVEFTQRMSEENQYIIEECDVEKVSSINILPKKIVNVIVKELAESNTKL